MLTILIGLLVTLALALVVRYSLGLYTILKLLSIQSDETYGVEENRSQLNQGTEK